MADPMFPKEIEDVAAEFKKIDREKLLRPSLGNLSLEPVFGSHFDAIGNRLKVALEAATHLTDESLSVITNVFKTMNDSMRKQANLSDPEYASQREPFLHTMKANLTELLQRWPTVAVIALERRGMFGEEPFEKVHEHISKAIQSESQRALETLKAEALKAMQQAEAYTNQLEERVQQTAQKVSVQEAQQQFYHVQMHLRGMLKLWAWLSGGAVAALLGLAVYFYFQELPDAWRWQLAYHAGIRVGILAAVAGLASYCLRVLRAHMHMYQQNRHREAVTNSIAAFVQAATSNAQRDLILTRLVDAVAAFGSSGLVPKDEASEYPKMTVESLVRRFVQPSEKGQ